ncbi:MULTISPECIES: DUF885 domain-containing protein [Pseudarthrobacter]|uniref:Uncharacterized protein (DUF885 family) n=1 Tax=Pseudarthrobacter niigatensis TaxID=369935 RepID=A0AAJ1SSB9_9MICC|nr:MULTISPECIES: DUF885 domain-containing protein [Pseudarthrobacter]MDQ0146276.1 uncharacterized protein (DUF885 family) [Pseudarthrobacter niigatensis]MDQ0264826.1 uncharacterized protein (DUF885 family) [Pseudarthrobacter niigatensis]QDG87723.1 DUF885 domain-containing protein [Pseudarthrobacter sp. NIBRBAC000502770]
MTIDTAPAARPHTRIDAVADTYTDTLIRLNPTFATTLGLPGHETEYQDFSPAGVAGFAEAARAALVALEGLEPEDDVDAVTLDAMQERLGLQLLIHASGWEYAELNNIASPAQDIRAIFDLMPTETEQDWEHIAGRAHNVPAAISGYTESLRLARDAGKVAAARQVRIVIEQVTKYAAGDGFFAKLGAGASTSAGPLPANLQEMLDAGADAARRAYSDLAEFLRTELLPAAPEKDAVGRARYALASRSFLGAEVDLEETYAWGVQELDRLIAEQEQVAHAIKPGTSIAEAKDILNNDPARQLKGTEALQRWMQDVSDRAVAELAGVHFDIPDVMKKLECRIAPTDEGGIYYTGPSDDFSRPGRMWWSVPAGEDTFTTWAETTTVYHEGVPGHHLQVATATYRRELLNKWRRNVCWTSGHGEGWALYAEKLMQELGYLDDPGDHMGMLDMQRMRAARVVFDIGVHLELGMPERWGTGTWTADKGYAFLKENLPISEGQLNFEFTRYLGWPGQAPSYKVGQRLWEQIRAELEARPGFDLKEFHTKALNIGSVGLDTLRRALLS